MSALTALVAAETVRLLRSPITLTLLVVVPLLQLVLFGLAIDPTGARLAIAIGGDNAAARQLAATAVTAEPGLRLAASGPAGCARAAVAAGRVRLGIELPAVASDPPTIISDGANPGLTAAAEARITAAWWQVVARRGLVADAAGPRFQRLHNPAARANWPLLAGLIGATVMIAMVMLGALSLARDREGGQWETLRTLPFGPATLIAGKLLPGVALGSVQGVLVLMAAVFGFGLPAPPAIWALLALLPLFAAVHLLIGFALAARAATQLAALQAAVAFYLPAMLLSGFLFPVETLPAWAAATGRLLPLTHMVAATEAALLHGRAATTVLMLAAPILPAGLLAALLSYAALVTERR